MELINRKIRKLSIYLLCLIMIKLIFIKFKSIFFIKLSKIYLGEIMKVCFLKYKNEKYYRIPQILGMHIKEIEEPERVDYEIEKLKKEKFETVVVSENLASFSEEIAKKYSKDNNLNIIIMPSK